MRFIKILLISCCYIAKPFKFNQFLQQSENFIQDRFLELYDDISLIETQVEDLLQAESLYVTGYFERLLTRALTSCSSCISALPTISRLTKLNYLKQMAFNSGIKVCKKNFNQTHSVCEGVVNTYGDWVLTVLHNADLNDKDIDVKRLFCYSLNNICDYPNDIPEPELKLEAPRQVKKTVNSKSENKKLYALQLSDFHLDPFYVPGSEAACNEPICCNKKPSNISMKVNRPASIWGDYNCDAPQLLIEDMFKFIVKQFPQLDMVLFTGDIPSHDVWNQSVATASKTESIAYKLMHQYFDPLRIPFFPTIGNHESIPANSFPTRRDLDKGSLGEFDNAWLYRDILNYWKDWLPESSLSQVKEQFGGYSMHFNSNLKILSIQTTFCYVLNFWILNNLHDPLLDPNSHLKWIVSELEASRAAGEKVYIVSHLPPGHRDCFRFWSEAWTRIIQSYSDVIVNQFYGHTHTDFFQLYYEEGRQGEADAAIGVSYIGPSITTFYDLNPGFRIYEIDADTYRVTDTWTYFADISKAREWELSGKTPEWKLEYRAVEQFGEGLESFEPLSPQWWHALTVKMEGNGHEFKTFLKHLNKDGPLSDLPCDDECKSNWICDLRSGNVTNSCTIRPPVSRHSMSWVRSII